MSAVSTQPAIEFKNVNFGYAPERKALKDVSFTINEGEYVCIIGHNGSGKSTISKVLMGLLKPQSGSVSIYGRQLAAGNLKEIRNDVGIVFQNPDNQFIGMTAEDDIAFGLENRKYVRDEMHRIVHQVAERLNITSLLKMEPSSLSGGQKQKVAIAGVLAFNPRIMIFDESTSMLDPVGKNELKQMILQLHKAERTKTIISITHDMEEVVNADRVLVLFDGKVMRFDTPQNVFSEEAFVKKMRLDLPFATKLSLLLAKDWPKMRATTDYLDLVRQICD